MAAPRILVFAGSARRDSWNRKLAAVAAAAVSSAGARVIRLEALLELLTGPAVIRCGR
ncbi:MAG: NAD(P)H-dependent oxidoreductase [Betaproteobacteria bacterium]|nr:NAD(P)H-dependent oxidoreductase [Betaproteobacteria bacterium]MBA3775646.1 NAD(P)H-dependent oxidoreductase [Betaproteobacteria bacterium]